MATGSDQARQGPLQKLRVLELGSTVAGPFCARMLADFGAEVIKVETPDGDSVRSLGSQFEGHSLYASSIMRNKRLTAIDLHKAAGRDLVRGLAAKSDIVIENFRPGTLEKWGLGYEALARDNPGLILVRISGFGQTGPYALRPGYGVICEAASGLRDITGDPDRPPTRVGMPLTDYVTGLHAAFGALAAVMARQATGRGQVIDATLYESAFNLMEMWIGAYDKLGHVPERTGPRLAGNAPNNLYPTRDGRYIQITAFADGPFRRLAGAIGRSEMLEDPRYATAIARAESYAGIDEVLGAWTSVRTLAEIEAALHAADVPALRIFNLADIFADPHYAARGAIVRAPDADMGTVAMSAVTPRLSATPGEVRHAGRRLGEDTEAVLSEVLGLDQARIEALRVEGIIVCKPDGTGHGH